MQKPLHVPEGEEKYVLHLEEYEQELNIRDEELRRKERAIERRLAELADAPSRAGGGLIERAKRAAAELLAPTAPPIEPTPPLEQSAPIPTSNMSASGLEVGQKLRVSAEVERIAGNQLSTENSTMKNYDETVADTDGNHVAGVGSVAAFKVKAPGYSEQFGTREEADKAYKDLRRKLKKGGDRFILTLSGKSSPAAKWLTLATCNQAEN